METYLVDTKKHWNKAYRSKAEEEITWFQGNPKLSLELIDKYAPDKTTGIIDVGGGSARLVDGLLHSGYQDVSVLDVSETALDLSKTRLGPEADNVNWIVADIVQWKPHRTWDAWHDRAVFHFLTAADDQDIYLDALSAATNPGAIVIIIAFALDGPEKCSGLPVQRYSAKTLDVRLGTGFRLLEELKDIHITPKGAQQNFVYAVFERVELI